MWLLFLMHVQRFFALLLCFIIFANSNYQLSTSTVVVLQSTPAAGTTPPNIRLASTKSLLSSVVTSTTAATLSLTSLMGKLASCRFNMMMATYAQDSYDSGINKRGGCSKRVVNCLYHTREVYYYLLISFLVYIFRCCSIHC